MFTKTHLFLSIPGVLFAVVGLTELSQDLPVALLMLLWGLMLTPVFWDSLESFYQKSFSFVHKAAWFLFVLGVVGVFVPAVEVLDSEPSQVKPAEATEAAPLVPASITSDTPTTEREEIFLPELLSESSSEAVRVVDVIDGDTLKVSLDGAVETVRVIGINTPETVHPNGIVECFGYEASAKAKGLLEGTTVSVVTDPTQGTRDKYDRYLAYITLEDGRDFGEVILREGYGYEYTYDGPYAHQATYKAAQTYAATNKQGLWADGACGGVGVDTRQEEYVAPVLPVTSDGACDIKGNISYSSGEKIYHVPGQENYDDTVINEAYGERWFCTEAEAVSAGWRKAKR